MKANILTVILLLVMAVNFALHVHSIGWTPLRLAGAAVAFLGFCLLLVARAQLGASFAIEAKANKLVTTGLYSRIRNPIYVFGGIALAALSVFLSPWAPLGVAAVIIPLQVYRSRNEERVLAQAFGAEYDAYKARTWF